LKFADDTKLYRAIDSPIESESVQADLDSVSNLVKCWQVEFNVTKCKVRPMHYGKRNNHFSYLMNEQKFEDVDHEKDPGVMFSSDLKVSAQCKEAYLTSNRILGLINKTIKYKNSATLINLYKQWSDLTWSIALL